MKAQAKALPEVVRAYLPPPLVRELSASPALPPTWGKWISGSLMHCDITGFTAMSESLAALGKEGAEIMAGVLNRFFERMLRIAEPWAGQQVKFGGDAMLLLFSGDGDASRAGACGLEMQRAMTEFSSLAVGDETYHLRMRIGIHSGDFYSASVGNPDYMLHYMLIGPDVSRSAAVEAAARPREVVVTSETAAQLRDRCRLVARQHGLYRLHHFTDELPSGIPADKHRHIPAERLRRYLLPSIQCSPSLVGKGLLAGDHRRITAMFINLLGTDRLLARGEEHALSELNAYVNLLLGLIDRHGGVLLGSDIADHGDKLIALFGAPVSQEHQEANAIRCAIEMGEALRASISSLQHRIGVNSGFVFAGEIGSVHRREYTVIGDAMNLAARLMAAARPGEVVVSAATAARTSGEFQLRRMRPLRVKGKAAPVRACRVGGATPPIPLPTPMRSAIVGRQRELGAVLDLARQVARGTTACAYLCGEAGIGKSRLAAEVADRLRLADWAVLVGQAHSYTAQAPFTPWLSVLTSMLGDETPTWEEVRSLLARLAPDRLTFAPLVADFLSVECPDDAGLASLDAQTRSRALTDTIVALLNGASRSQPLLLLFEDLHWIDAASLELLAELRRATVGRLLIVLTSREPPPGELAPDLAFRIEPLSGDHARQLLEAASSLAPELIQAVLTRAQGNPLFLTQLALAGETGADLPESVSDVLMARIDRLDSDLKSIVRVASVIGPTFDEPLMQTLLQPAMSRGTLRSGLAELQRLGFLRREHEAPGVQAFSHIVARDAVYESLPFAQRRRLHGSVLQHLETGSAPPPVPAELLLHHAEGANDMPRVVRYAALSGDRAAAVFANTAALDYYRKSLVALSRSHRHSPADESLLMERIAGCEETLGRHKQAAATCATALDVWLPRQPRRSHFVPGPRLDNTREAVLCRKIGVSLERECDYVGALDWLRRAVATTPPRQPRLSAQVCGAMCVSLFRKGLHEDGAEWGSRALTFALRSRDLREVAYARNMLATCFMERGDLGRAIRHLREAVRLYHELGDFPGQASANNNLGMCYHLQGTLDAALYHYQVALRTDERVGDQVDAAIVQGNIGEVLLALGRIAEAVQNLSAVVNAHQRGAGLAAVAGLAHVNLSRCQLAMGDTESSERHLRRARRLLKDVGAEALLMEADLQRAQLLLSSRHYPAAVTSVRRTLIRIRELRAQLLESRGERILGEALGATGHGAAAEEHLRTSISLARRIGAAHEEARSAIALARHLLRSRNSQSRASSYLRRAEKIFRKMGAELELREASSLSARAA